MSKLLAAAVRHVEPLVEPAAGSELAKVYADMDALVGLLPPFLVHSPDADLTRAVWVFGREAWLAGAMPRLQREAIAAAVSSRNVCPFCVEAHTMSLTAAGRADPRPAGAGDDPVAAVTAWASSPASSSAAPPNPVPDEHVGPAIATLVAFEYMNRVVNVLAADNPLAAVPKPMRGVMRRAGAKKIGTAILAANPDPSMHLIAAAPGMADTPGWIDPWDATWPELRASVIDVACVARRGLAAELGTDAVARIDRLLDDWDGGIATSAAAVDAARERRAAERLVVTVAVRSHDDTDALVDEVRAAGADDRSLVRLVAGGAWLAAERIGRWRSV